jgi:hypothetical protein
MTKSQFKEAFRRGLGSAYIELKNCSSLEKYKDIVLWCCLHNTCYDMQCEGERGIYLYDSISLYEDRNPFEEAIIKKFMNKKLDTWVFDQLCNLLCRFAMDGSLRARDALYGKYDKLFTLLSSKRDISSLCTERDNFEWLCVWLTSLDGFRAFKRIVEQIGEFFISAKDTNIFNLDWFYANAQDKFRKKRVDNYMRNSASKNKAVEAFLNEIESFESHNPQSIDSPSLKQLMEACSESAGYRSRGIALHFARTALAEELIELAQVALKETNLDIKLGLLWAFRKVPFPLDERYIFELAESDNKSIREIAFDMMQHLSSDKIHDYAIKLIKEKKEMVNSLSLLCHCYQPEDETLLAEGVKGLSVTYNYGGWHGVFMDVKDLLDKHPYKFDPSLFIHIYQQTLCSSCRALLVQSMYKQKILPRKILEECLYDSYEDTRKFATLKLK